MNKDTLETLQEIDRELDRIGSIIAKIQADLDYLYHKKD